MIFFSVNNILFSFIFLIGIIRINCQYSYPPNNFYGFHPQPYQNNLNMFRLELQAEKLAREEEARLDSLEKYMTNMVILIKQLKTTFEMLHNVQPNHHHNYHRGG
uniref:Uncharacterized protein n=1 Tax=Strongyloides stercoralis TaxID=6248 RepID=A0A0K0DZU0_STRER